MSELHERIRYARKKAGLSQEKLAAACKPPVSKAAAGLWESKKPDKRTQPTYKNLMTISKMTGAPLEWLLSDDANVDDWSARNAHDDQEYIYQVGRRIAALPEILQVSLLDVIANYEALARACPPLKTTIISRNRRGNQPERIVDKYFAISAASKTKKRMKK